MIATIILGFGLLMIGAVLPIAWKGSLEATSYTVAEGASQTAKFHVNKKCRVDGLRDLFDPLHNPLAPPDGLADSPDPAGQPVSYSFVGDVDTPDAFVDLNGDSVIDYKDSVPRVHALHMENWAMDADSLFICNDNLADDLSLPEAPILISIPLTDLRTV